jgi:hypothetical protein
VDNHSGYLHKVRPTKARAVALAIRDRVVEKSGNEYVPAVIWLDVFKYCVGGKRPALGLVFVQSKQNIVVC